jgi:Pvc16 N-terminal domain
VIHEVDDALSRLVREVATRRGVDIEVAFDAPTKDWAARRNAPTVNVYLYDIREDLRRRQRGMLNEYGQRREVVARHLPPRHIKLSYLVTAWTQRPEEEHRLLSYLLVELLRHEAVPARLLSGSLAALQLPAPLTVALPPPEDRAFADVWTALGGELKPSLDVVVSAPVESGRVFPAERPPQEGLQLDVGGDGRVAHRVTADGDGPAGDRAAADGDRIAMVRRPAEQR